MFCLFSSKSSGIRDIFSAVLVVCNTLILENAGVLKGYKIPPKQQHIWLKTSAHIPKFFLVSFLFSECVYTLVNGSTGNPSVC